MNTSLTFTHNGREYPNSCHQLWELIEGIKDIKEASGILTAYCKTYYHGKANLHYMLSNNPYHELFNLHWYNRKKLEEAERNVWSLERKREEDSNSFWKTMGIEI